MCRIKCPHTDVRKSESVADQEKKIKTCFCFQGQLTIPGLGYGHYAIASTGEVVILAD